MTTYQNLDAARLPQKLHVQWSMKTEHDDSGDTPADRNEGFWPSRDKDAAGYVPPADFEAAYEAAEASWNGWRNGDWHYVGVIAVADILIPIGGTSFRVVQLESSGLWGIESDSTDYLKEVYKEQKGELMDQIKSLGQAIIEGDFSHIDIGG